jgi:predicted  nucleic acid-binding Zn-ribbon protein
MADRGKKVYPMTLSQFHSYLGDKLKELQAGVKEIDEIRVQFEAAFRQELAAWQERFSFCYPLIKADRAVLPTELRARLDVIEREENAKIRGEIAELTVKVRTAKTNMDQQMAQAAVARQELRTANPDLNRREEKLKAEVVALQNQYAALYEQEEKARNGVFSWLTRGGELRRLQRDQKKVKAQQAKVMEDLKKVRAAWMEKVQTTSEAQAQLSSQWQALGVDAATDEARLAFLSANTADLAEQNAIQRLLVELDSPPDVAGELGAKLAELAKHNRIRASYEKGMADVSLSLGLMKGIGTGLEKFRESVGKVVAEQRRYNLKNTQVPVPASVAVINQTWKFLADKLHDENYMGQNPLAFSEVVAKYVSNRLTDQTIQRFFEEMGAALNRATAAWH